MTTKIFYFDGSKTPAYLDSIEDCGRYFIVRLKGSIDTSALERDREKMTAIIRQVNLYSKSIICDFAKVTQSDTATLAALLRRLSDFRGAGGSKLVFCSLPSQLKEFIIITKFSEIFSIAADEKAAAANLQ